ncbi:MAG: DMT family transporter [Anaerolineae bacterium]
MRQHRIVSWLPLVAGLIWGTAFPAIEIGLRTFSPLDVAFWRGFIGALSLGGWLAIQGGLHWRFPRATWVRLFVLALAGSGLFWPIQSVAVNLSTPVNVAFLITTYPAMLSASGFLLGEEVRRRDVASLVLALAGAYLIISDGKLLRLFASQTLPGDTLALVAAVSFAAYILLGRRWRETMGISSQTLTFYTFALAVPVLLLFTFTDGSSLTPPTIMTAGAVVWLGLMATTVAFLAVNRGMQSGAISRSSVHLLVIPLVTAIVSWVLFGIALTVPQWIGGVLVLAGIANSSRI